MPAFVATAQKPNVLFIAIDDLNHWVGYLGRSPQTKKPNIDKLAQRGVWFTHSYCAAPVCNPSRAALMSGLRPGATGVYENRNDWRTVISEDLPLTDLCGLPTPSHVQGRSIRSLLANPASAWAEPAVTTYRYMNHAVRTEGWRHIRYAQGGEELYDESKDPYEWFIRAEINKCECATKI